MEIRTLCLRCKSAYEGAGYKVYKISNQTIKANVIYAQERAMTTISKKKNSEVIQCVLTHGKR